MTRANTKARQPCRLAGLRERAEALLKKNLSRFVAAESQDDFYLHCQQVFTNAGLQTCDLQMRRDDGATFRGRLESVVETAGPGQPALCLVALSDVTRLLQAEALSQSEANYRALFELNPAPMWICDEDTLAFLDVNEAAQKLYGWPRNQFLRLTAKDIRPPEDVPEFLRHVKQQRGSRVAFVGERRHLKRDGSLFDVAVTISSIPYAGREARLALVNESRTANGRGGVRNLHLFSTLLTNNPDLHTHTSPEPPLAELPNPLDAPTSPTASGPRGC